MALGKAAWTEARQTLQSLLSIDNQTLRDDQALRAEAIIPQTDVVMHLPATIGNKLNKYNP